MTEITQWVEMKHPDRVFSHGVFPPGWGDIGVAPPATSERCDIDVKPYTRHGWTGMLGVCKHGVCAYYGSRLWAESVVAHDASWVATTLVPPW